MVSLFLLLGCNLSYNVDLLTALHELASASARTLLRLASSMRALLKPYGDTLNHIWQGTFPFKALIPIFWDLQPLWPSSLTKPDLLRVRCSSGHVLSKTKSVTPPNFFTFLTSLTHRLSMVKFSEKNQC